MLDMENSNYPQKPRGQMSAEMVIVASVAVMVLLGIYVVNGQLQTSWEGQKERLSASSASERAAMVINRVAAGGNGTFISFENTVPSEVTMMEIFEGRSVRAYYALGGYASSPIVTGNININEIPLNQQVVVANEGGTIVLRDD